jgi:hypothetical protein
LNAPATGLLAEDVLVALAILLVSSFLPFCLPGFQRLSLDILLCLLTFAHVFAPLLLHEIDKWDVEQCERLLAGVQLTDEDDDDGGR